MTKFKMENFGGEVPALDNRLMPDNHGAISINTWLLSGRIEPVHAIVKLRDMESATASSFFRLPKGNPDIDSMIDSYWLEFENPNVRVIKSPVAGQDDNGRYYWADGVYPKMMTGDMIATVPQPEPYRLGVPLPPTAPVVTDLNDGVSTINQSRAYTYTWVTGLGEEGPPAFSEFHTAKVDDTWVVTLAAPGPAETANRNLTHTRIYRSITGSQGVASYFFVTEIPIATLVYNDTMSDADVVLNEQLESLEWSEPPADLQGMVSLPNGVVAGWRKNEVWFCEPYHPHAWPLRYKIAVPNDIVGLGVNGQSVIILTEGSPWSATGIDPASMALAVIQPIEPCTSRLSIVNTPNGVLYSSPNGLINITAAGTQNLTKGMILKDQWADTLHLNSIAAAVLSQSYYAYSISMSGVFQTDTFQGFVEDGGTVAPPPPDPLADTPAAFQFTSNYGTLPGLLLSLEDLRLAKTTLQTLTTEVRNVITDIFNGEVMILRDDEIYVVDMRKSTPYAKYRWRSKMFQTPYPQNMAAAKIYWTPPTDSLMTTAFRVFAASTSEELEDGLPKRFEQKLTKSGQMLRLPSGFKAMYWQFEVEGYAAIDSIHVATSARELRGI